jgi:hypothetical protein
VKLSDNATTTNGSQSGDGESVGRSSRLSSAVPSPAAAMLHQRLMMTPHKRQDSDLEEEHLSDEEIYAQSRECALVRKSSGTLDENLDDADNGENLSNADSLDRAKKWIAMKTSSVAPLIRRIG